MQSKPVGGLYAPIWMIPPITSQRKAAPTFQAPSPLASETPSGKKEVLERTRANIIKYSRYERKFDAFGIYGDTVIVIGSETVVPTPDAARPDAGQTVHRRFAEVWLRRNGQWQKVVRHASTVGQE